MTLVLPNKTRIKHRTPITNGSKNKNESATTKPHALEQTTSKALLFSSYEGLFTITKKQSYQIR